MWIFKKSFNIKGREINSQDELDRVFIATGSSEAKFLTDKGFIAVANKQGGASQNKKDGVSQNKASSEAGAE
jgi:hypothetical protein